MKFWDRPDVKEAEEIWKLAEKKWEEVLKKKVEYKSLLKDYYQKLADARKEMHEEYYKICEEISSLREQEEALYKEFNEKQYRASFVYVDNPPNWGGGRLRFPPLSDKEKAECERKKQELAEEYQVKIDKIARKVEETQKKKEEKWDENKELCKIFGCDLLVKYPDSVGLLCCEYCCCYHREREKPCGRIFWCLSDIDEPGFPDREEEKEQQ